MDSPLKFFISSAPGLEELLYEEVKAMGYLLTRSPSGVFEFEGSWEDAAHIAVRSRLASRMLYFVKRFNATNVDVLYHKVLNINWPKFLRNNETFAIFTTGQSSPDMAISFLTLKIKDAICDRFRKEGMERPNIDRSGANIRIEAHVKRTEVSLAIDLIGYPLHRRNYRTESAEAAMKENRAAALLYFAGFQKGEYSAIVDPFCGSGTILGEAHLIDTQTAPGLVHLRPSELLSVQPLWNDWKAALEKALEEARTEKREGKTRIIGIESERREFGKAQENLSKIRSRQITLDHSEASSLAEMKLEKPLIVTNPPHGHRLLSPKQAQDLLRDFVSMLKHKVAPCTLALQLSDDDLPKAVGLRPSKKMSLKAGEYKMVFMLYDIQPGSFRKEKASEA
jgi:23S rRNA G2445 N2-methylase RlmL